MKTLLIILGVILFIIVCRKCLKNLYYLIFYGYTIEDDKNYFKGFIDYEKGSDGIWKSKK